MPECNTCHKPFGDFKALAKHILENRFSHGHGVYWAQKFLTNADFLNQKVEKTQSRMPLTEQDKINKEDSQRILSGQEMIVLSICPNCAKSSRTSLPIEHTQSCTSWKINGKIAVNCYTCRR